MDETTKRVKAVQYRKDGEDHELVCDECISTIPIPHLVQRADPAPEAAVLEAAREIRYKPIAIYGLLVGILETFGRRAIVLENLGAIDGLKRGWAVFRSKIGDSIVLAILLAVVGFVVGIVIAIPLAVFGVGAVVGTAVLSNGIENMPWALVAVGILLFVVLAAVIGSYFTAMNSAVWTLAYRSFTTADSGQPTAVTTTPADDGRPPAADAPSTEGAP
jgi:hypothetical protein